MSSTDILTLGEAKAALATNQDFNDSDALLNGYITAISKRLDEVCGPIVTRTITDELYDGYGNSFWLKTYPVSSVTTVTEYDGTIPTVLTQQTNTVHPTQGYLIELASGKLTRTSSGSLACFAPGQQNIKVTYQAGRYADTASVASLFKIAAQAFLAHVWKMNQGMGSQTYGDYDAGGTFTTFALPNRVKDLLGAEIQSATIA